MAYYIAILGAALALGQFIYAQGHAIIASAPNFPAEGWVRHLVRFREQILVTAGIAALTIIATDAVSDPWRPYLLGVFGGTSVLSFLLGVLLFSGAPQVRDTIAREMGKFAALRAEHSRLQSDVLRDVSSDEGSIPRPREGLSPRAGLSPRPPSPDIGKIGESDEWALDADTTQVRRVRSAVDTMHRQRLVTQTMWDLPVAMLHIDLEGRVVAAIGGALRMSVYPQGLARGSSVKGTSLEAVVREVKRQQRPHPLCLRWGGHTFTAVASPWVSNSAALRGVVVLVMHEDESSQPDSSEALPFRVVAHG